MKKLFLFEFTKSIKYKKIFVFIFILNLFFLLFLYLNCQNFFIYFDSWKSVNINGTLNDFFFYFFFTRFIFFSFIGSILITILLLEIDIKNNFLNSISFLPITSKSFFFTKSIIIYLLNLINLSLQFISLIIVINYLKTNFQVCCI